jgi:hypothetical protein
MAAAERVRFGPGLEWAPMPEKPAITLTPAQLEQLADFRTERKGIDRTVGLREAPNLGTGYVEAVLLDSDGEETTGKRILFPN